MTDWPRISVVTSSYNQGPFIRRTIDSVRAQEYPNVEHIIVDGLSADETPAILRDYPDLQVIREKDSGQADAINKGFRRATGHIWCFLNSDDTFERGAFKRVAQEIRPAEGRHIVMGRCRFIDENDRFIGVEHPSAYESHARVLAIWKGYTIPQPAVFWTPEVWQTCGALNEREQLMLDYDLFCRFSRSYHFHVFDQIVANYRLHMASKTQGVDDDTRLQAAVQVSRRYWGPWWMPRGATLRVSYARHRFDRKGRGYRLMQTARHRWRTGDRLNAFAKLTQGAMLAPDVALNAVLPPVRRMFGPRLRRLVNRAPVVSSPKEPSPLTEAWQGFVELHPDGWAGPLLEQDRELASGQSTLVVVGDTIAAHLPAVLKLELLVDGHVVSIVDTEGRDTFELRVAMREVTPGRRRILIHANTFLVPHDLWGNQDFRPLSFRLRDLRFVE
jgi:glycosyltransferase involved in cell wall biosynthesis